MYKIIINLFAITNVFLISSGATYAKQSSNFTSKSNNPVMFLTDEDINLKARTAPPASKVFVKTNESVIYDAKNKEETILSNYSYGNSYGNSYENNDDSKNYFEPFSGILTSDLSLSARILGKDNRKRIRNTTDYPWRTITKLEITFPDGKKSKCSGAIIDNFHALTAGHCVYSRGHGGYGKIKLFPGQNGNYTPFSYATSTRIRSNTQWTTNRSPNYDWALITLDRNIGLYTGWMGLKKLSKTSPLYKKNLNITGYPNDRLKGTMWNSFEKGHSTNEYRHFYTMDTSGGQSGAPVWGIDAGKRYILSIHAYGDSSATPGITNAGVRINNYKYYQINNWRTHDRSPVDKPDLIDDGSSFAGFSPGTISAGKVLSMHSDVRNIGTANSGTFYVSFYASKDTTITKSDYYLGKVRISSIKPFDKTNAKLKSTFPSNIPAGAYYIGWITDSTNAKNEFNEKNNTGFKYSPKLIVNYKNASTSALIAPKGTIKDNTPTYTWRAVSGSSYYQLWVKDSKGTKIKRWYKAASLGCRKGTGKCSITPTIKLANGNGNWKIRTWINRKYGSWSAAKSFKISKKQVSVGSSSTSTLIAPSGTIKDSTPSYIWKAVSGSSYYQLWVKDSKGTKIKRWYKAASLGCRSGTGKCSVTPTVKLANGSATWKIRTWINRKYGSWSTAKTFKISQKQGNSNSTIATLIAPTGTIKDSTPKYIWKAVFGASYYQLWVKDSRGTKVKRWYKARSVGCQSGTGTCSINPSIKLATGNASWKVRARVNLKYRSWSASKSFKVSSSQSTSSSSSASLISPSGSIKDSTPKYIWKSVSGASYYQLWVTDSTGTKIKHWYRSSAVNCSRGTGNCSISPNIKLANGSAYWKIRTWRKGKYSSWSTAKSFKISRTINIVKTSSLNTPNGVIKESTPIYTWKAVSGASYYQLWVRDSRGRTRLKRWYKASATACKNGSCSIRPRNKLANGRGSWKVRSWNRRHGYSQWSKSVTFIKR